VLQRYLLRAVGFGAATGHGRRSPAPQAGPCSRIWIVLPGVLHKLIPSP
jgi:hypothetical protein